MVLTYDITREDTFLNIVNWLHEVRQNSNSDILLYLVGNRADLEDEREVTKERAIDLCREMKIDGFFETSAKTGIQVEEMFS